MRKKYAIGADAGGSHISVITMDLEKEAVLRNCKACCVVDNKASADNILASWKSAIEKSISGIDRDTVIGYWHYDAWSFRLYKRDCLVHA